MTDRLLKDQEKTAEVIEGDKYIRATIVTPVRVAVDEGKLYDLVDDDTWLTKLTEPKFSRAMFEAHLDTVDEATRTHLLGAISEKPSKPHIRYTAGEVKADEEEGH